MRGPLPLKLFTRARATFEGGDLVLRPDLLGRTLVPTWRLNPEVVTEVFQPPMLGRIGVVALKLRAGPTLQLQMGEAEQLLASLKRRGYAVKAHS